MLTHVWPQSRQPTRVVVLGGRGFLAGATVDRLHVAGVSVLALPAANLDLTAEDAADRLAAIIRPDDAVVMFSALTPDKGRDIDTSMRNLAMGRTMCAALARSSCAHVVYISSDAVYPFDLGCVSESTPAVPTDLYGCMHRMRELMVVNTVKDAPVAILRPTQVYGAADSHNSYGPNRFRRQAAASGQIVLGGNGEETRDHILVDDAVSLILRCLTHRSAGLLNLATGRSIAFAELARLVAGHFSRHVEVTFTPRTAPVTHRSFDITACLAAFPDFAFTSLEQGLADTHRKAGTA